MTQEVVMLVGMVGAGKSSHAQSYINQGYVWLNRDTIGGKIVGLLPLMERALQEGKSVILDNTHVTIEHREPFITLAKQYKTPIHCKYFNTSFEDCQYNLVNRILEKYGRLLSPSELEEESKRHSNIFNVHILYSFRKRLQLPTDSEGFDSVQYLKFKRDDKNHTQLALILDYDGTLRTTKSGNNYPIDPDDVVILPGRREKLLEYKEKGYKLFGISNQSGVHKGSLTEEQAKACFQRTNELLNLDIEYYFCSHQSAPINCYCRKPGNGFGVYLIWKHKLNAANSLMVGDMTTDKSFSERCGFQYLDQKEFFV
jgi:histidinol-phosphate phosphatase family protein